MQGWQYGTVCSEFAYYVSRTVNRSVPYFSSNFEAYCTRDGNRSGQLASVGLPVGSRFFDRPVKPVETPVKFSFLATKRHLSTNQNILIHFIINKTFYKKSVLTNHTFRKHLLNGFKLWLICCDH